MRSIREYFCQVMVTQAKRRVRTTLNRYGLILSEERILKCGHLVGSEVVFRIWVSGHVAYLFDDLVDVVGEERGPLAVARVDVLVHDLHAVE